MGDGRERRDSLEQVLEVNVFDYDVVGADDFMGRVKIPLEPLGDKLWHKEWYPLTNDKGEIDLVKVVDFNQLLLNFN